MSAQRLISYYPSEDHDGNSEVEKGLNRELLQQFERVQQFEYMASHNLRGPVATILGLSQLLNLDSQDQNQHKQIVNYIKQTALQLDSIIKDLQQVLGRQQQGHLIKEEISLGKLMQSVTKDLEESISKTGSGILCDFSEAPTIYGTSTNLRNIFTQLLSNAIKFRKADTPPLIEVNASLTPGYVCICIKDNGLGFDQLASGHKLFQPYTRFHTHVEGKGLGLYLTRSLLWQMGGEIDIQSMPGMGTSCTLFIPRPQVV